MSFFECEFPRSIGFISTGGDGFSTQVNEGFSGQEQRNRNWSKSKRKFAVPLNGKDNDTFELVRAFFLNVAGKADGFRFYWPLDHSILGQSIGVGNNSATQFQLVKTYAVGGRTYTYTIKKPIQSTVQAFDGGFLANTVKIYLDGVLKTLGSDYTVDATTGIVTFTTHPGTGVVITADCDFHIPVRFDIDDMGEVQIISHDLKVKWSSVPLVEVRL
jgi:uncharacterized protein (TIGR02217 family)